MFSNLLRLALWCAVITAFTFAVLPQPVPLPATDKIQHMLAFFTLAILGSAAYPRLSPVRLAAWLIAFGGLIELVQTIPLLNRNAELADWGADIVATLAGLALAALWRRIARPAT